MKPQSKLLLSKETVRQLNISETEEVAAGKQVIRHSLFTCTPTNPLVCLIIGPEPLPW